MQSAVYRGEKKARRRQELTAAMPKTRERRDILYGADIVLINLHKLIFF